MVSDFVMTEHHCTRNRAVPVQDVPYEVLQKQLLGDDQRLER